MNTPRIALLVVSLAACKRAEEPGRPQLFVDPGRVDLAVDTPLDTFRSVDIALANVGDARANLVEIAISGEHASLVTLDAGVPASLAPGEVVFLTATLNDAGDPFTSPFWEELQLTVAGEDAESGDALEATAVVEVGTLWSCDVDADGFIALSCGGDDCDDEIARVNPGMIETCDDLDDDCDGFIDEDDAIDAETWFPNVDGDAFGDDATAFRACERPEGALENGGDCDDTDPNAFPGAVEVCNTKDDDCDGRVDADAVDALTFYGDADQDKFGDAAEVLEACKLRPGYTPDATDCDDAVATTHPGAVELCNSVDDDCDGAIDDKAVGQIRVFADTDFDGHGAPGTPLLACGVGPGQAASADDCDDTSPGTYPGAPEFCDHDDQDCDGVADDGLPVADYHPDLDVDGYGVSTVTVTHCAQPADHVLTGGDCDDEAKGVNPGAAELCDGVDQDCDAVIDDGAIDGKTWFIDADSDTFGGSSTLIACAQPPGTAASSTDCDDKSAAVNPVALELCNGVDDNCDGKIDEGTVPTWFADADGDKFGDKDAPAAGCIQPPGTVADATDCDDKSPTRFPGAPELCNGLDDDCDNVVDDGVPVGGIWFPDTDKDTFGDGKVGVVACAQPPDTIVDGTDCDDKDAAVNPAALELCNGKDDDCDGQIDDGAPLPATWFTDADGDTFGDKATAVTSCVQPPGTVSDGTDCDDKLATINPAAPELCNGKDDDCDGQIDDGVPLPSTWYTDVDADTFGDPNTGVTSCDPLPGSVTDNTDCNDKDAAVHPGATEQCNAKDDDCDGAIDDGVVFTNWFIDRDADTYGNANKVLSACKQPVGFVTDSKDCNDNDKAVNPGAKELCNGLDDDCDGSIDEGAVTTVWFADADGDQYGDPNGTQDACIQPEGFVSDQSDCDDNDPTVNPAAIDSCLDGRDRNCDGAFDACDGCHVFEPVDLVGWTKSFRVNYQGSIGSEVQTGTGPAVMPDGRDGYAVHSTLGAGSRAWDVDSFQVCDAQGALLQAGSGGTTTDPAYGTITFIAEDLPARVVLPPASQFNSGVTWSFSYVLTTTVDPNFLFDIPTNGTSRDAGLETITVGAGTFLTWRIESRWNQDNSTWGGTQDRRQSTFWYAEGIGLVRERTTDRNTGAVVMQKELASYSGLTAP